MSEEQTIYPSAASSRAGSIILWGLVLVVFVALLALGTWQVERLRWKEALIARIDQQLVMPPVGLAEIEALQRAGEPVEYRPMTVSGTFDHTREQHFFATYEGQPGFYVYTPLRLDDGRSLFLNRGFVPFDRKEAATRGEGQVNGQVTVIGLAREPLTEKPSWVLPDNEPQKNIFYWKDLGAMAQNARLANAVPLFLDANDAPNPGGLPVGGVTMVSLPNNHLQYAVTWYGLAGALVVIALVFARRDRKERGSDERS